MCAEIYHCADFITSDPVQFPHRYTLKQDIEISGLLTAIMSFGNRKQILKKADELHRLMGDSPYQYVLSRQWEVDFLFVVGAPEIELPVQSLIEVRFAPLSDDVVLPQRTDILPNGQR